MIIRVVMLCVGFLININAWDAPAQSTVSSDRYSITRISSSREVRAEEDRLKNEQKAKERWLGAMPASLKPYWDAMSDPSGTQIDPELLNDALVVQIPDAGDRILALFGWYGAGEGAWTDFPVYEKVPEKMLSLYEMEDILNTIQSKQMARDQTEGAARYFACGQGKDALPTMPPQMREFFLEHVLSNDISGIGSEDRRDRAMAAFSE